ncbi:MAG: PAS domain S-box protein, partial [Propionivibrio sp.]
MKGGAADYLTKKPSNIAKLPAAIRTALEKARIAAECGQVHDALHESEERLRAIADSSKDAIVAVNENNRISFFSPGAEAMFGYTQAEAIGQPTGILMPDALRAAHDAGFARYLATRQPLIIGHTVELIGQRKNGESFPLELALSSRELRGQLLCTAIIRDISERKASEAQITRLTWMYKALSLCNEAIMRCTREDQLFQAVCEACVEVGGLQTAMIGRIDAATGTVRFQAAHGVGAADRKSRLFSLSDDDPFSRSPNGTAIREERPYWCQDYLHDPRTETFRQVAHDNGWLASAGLPLRRNGIVVGVLTVYANQLGVFDEPIRELLLQMAANLSFAMDNIVQQDQLVNRTEELERGRATLLGALEGQREAQAALRRSEERFRGFVENASDLTIELSPPGLLTYVSPNWMRFIGEPASDALGKPFGTYVHRDDVAECLRAIQDAANATEHVSADFRVMHRDGSVRWLSGRGVALRDEDGRVSGFQGVARDTSERRVLDEQLRNLAQAVEQSPESIVITNLAPEIEYVNAAFLAATGYLREEVIGKNPRVLHSGKTPPENYVAMWQALSAGRTWKGEFYNRRKDGSEYIEFAIITPIRQPDGTISHYVAVKEDITEKKRNSEELDRYRHQLEEMVDTRTVQLTLAQEQAEAANRAKSAFIANMSHEIRTPMNAILGLAYLLRNDGTTPEQVERLEKIDSAGRHLLAIINDILDFSKIESGRLQLESIDFPLAAVFDSIVAIVGQSARDKGLRIEIDGDAVPLWLRGDQTRIRQALLNYFGNAVKFTEKGSIVLRAKLREDSGDEVLVRFEVADT